MSASVHNRLKFSDELLRSFSMTHTLRFGTTAVVVSIVVHVTSGGALLQVLHKSAFCRYSMMRNVGGKCGVSIARARFCMTMQWYSQVSAVINYI